MIKAAILGGTGYGGMELLRYLAGHPEVEVTAVTSRSQKGPVANRWAHLAGYTDAAFTEDTDDTRRLIATSVDVLFAAKPHGVAASELPPLLEAAPDLKVIDLSGDFRLPDASAYDAWYGYTHPHAEWLGRSEYGLPECGQREAVADARLVANPGCHATAALIALWPLARAGLVTGRMAVNSVTGSSGSGAHAKAGTHHPERASNFKAYRPLRHQHLPEVVRALGSANEVDFVPHSAPFARGIHVTAFVPVGDATEEQVDACFHDAYADEPFVRLRDKPPEVRAVAGTNLADVSVTTGRGVAVVMVAIDNLGKGMAGTAVQNLNLVFGFPETTGLDRPGAGL
ncbi:MAG: N-acetyl-gamma-glutamyl-phosphate reductase [Planctomycetota bacterium]|nr:N-acetyl-gamma-glutamyl-phosphate reductase [Planctomycetota bacterium]